MSDPTLVPSPSSLLPLLCLLATLKLVSEKQGEMLKWCENDSKYRNVKSLGDRWGILIVIHRDCCVVNLWQGLSEEAKSEFYLSPEVL